jgi:hypothetical protein
MTRGIRAEDSDEGFRKHSLGLFECSRIDGPDWAVTGPLPSHETLDSLSPETAAALVGDRLRFGGVGPVGWRGDGQEPEGDASEDIND